MTSAGNGSSQFDESLTSESNVELYSRVRYDNNGSASSLYISLNDKLRLTRAIWYLPTFNRKSIKKLLKNKEIGVSAHILDNIQIS